MYFSIFMGAILAYVASISGWAAAVLLALFVASFHRYKPRVVVQKVPEQQTIFQLIATLQIEKYSETIIGTLRDNPIHSYIVAKYPGENRATTYFYDDIIQYNEWGQICHAPRPGEVYTTSGLVYKKLVVAQPQPLYR